MLVLSFNSRHQNTRPIINRLSPQTRLDSRLWTGLLNGPSILMEGDRGQLEYHNKQNNDKEEYKCWFAILLSQLLQPFSATSDSIIAFKELGPLFCYFNT